MEHQFYKSKAEHTLKQNNHKHTHRTIPLIR